MNSKLRIAELRDSFRDFPFQARANVPTFYQAAHQADNLIRFNTALETVDFVCMRANGAIWLVRFWSLGEWKKVAVLAPAEC